MVLESGAECGVEGPPPFSRETGSQFRAAAREVYDIGRTLTEEQRTVATFWADNAGATGTPAGHWIAIVGQLARQRHLSLAAAAEAYARVGLAVHDAFVACWHEKYRSNLQRPVTYIRNQIDPGWTPYLVTPGFPAYTSGGALPPLRPLPRGWGAPSGGRGECVSHPPAVTSSLPFPWFAILQVVSPSREE